MVFKTTKRAIILDSEAIELLHSIAFSRTESICHVERAQILIYYYQGLSIKDIICEMQKSPTAVYNCINKALQFGPIAALDDLPRSGRPAVITDEAKTWILDIACRKPKDMGLPYEFWTRRVLAKYLREHCKEHGYICLSKIANGTVTKILNSNNIKPHKIIYYLEKRDPDFDIKRKSVLSVYGQAAFILAQNDPELLKRKVYISFDEKTGIQAIQNTAPDLPPLPGKHTCFSRDHEYKRLGTVSLLAGMNVVTGTVDGIVEERHRSLEFIKYLKRLDSKYKSAEQITIILDNHSAHTSKETRAYLSSMPNRFQFIFTPKHGSWLNIIESFFGTMSKSLLRGIRVDSIEELKRRIIKYLQLKNKDPVPYNWKYF
jgi:transposase